MRQIKMNHISAWVQHELNATTVLKTKPAVAWHDRGQEESSCITERKRETARHIRSDRSESQDSLLFTIHWQHNTQMSTVTWITSHQAASGRERERGTRIEQTYEQIQQTHTSIAANETKHLPVTVDAPEARKDVSEAGVAVKFGLTLGAFYRALQPPTEEALTARERERQRQSIKRCHGYFVRGSLRDVNHGAQLGGGTEHINTDICAPRTDFGEAGCHE